jgi:hypothetical protein
MKRVLEVEPGGPTTTINVNKGYHTIARPTLDDGTPLCQQDVEFVVEFCRDLNPLAAVLRLGYDELIAEPVAREFISKPHLQEAIAKRLTIYGQNPRKLSITPADMGVTPEYILLKLKQIADYDNMKAHCKADLVQPQVKLKALEMLGKHIGMFGDKDGDQKNEVYNVFDDKTRQELLDRLANARANKR